MALRRRSLVEAGRSRSAGAAAAAAAPLMRARMGRASALLLLLVLVLVIASGAAAASSSSTPAHSKKGNKKSSPYATTAYVDENFTELFEFLKPLHGQAVTTLSADGLECTTKVNTQDGEPNGITAACGVPADAALPTIISNVRCPFPYLIAAESTCEGSVFDKDGNWVTLLPLRGSGTSSWAANFLAVGYCSIALDAIPVPPGGRLEVMQFLTCTYRTSVYDPVAARAGNPEQRMIGTLVASAKAKAAAGGGGVGASAMVLP